MTKEPEDGNGKEQRLEEHRKGVQKPQDQHPSAEKDQNQGKKEPYFPEIFLG